MPADQGKAFSYLRVSTDRQGQRGYGLEAQHKAIADYLTGGSWELLGEFVEIESGKRNDRPQLEAALAACKRHKAKLVIAKLDRLSRNLAFIATLMERRVDFVCCDMPEANRLTIHIIAAMAEHERSMISERTKAALAAAKARGVRLGEKKLAEARKAARVSIMAGADRYAANVIPIIREIQRAGAKTREDIADALNARGIATARGPMVWLIGAEHPRAGGTFTGIARQGHPGPVTGSSFGDFWGWVGGGCPWHRRERWLAAFGWRGRAHGACSRHRPRLTWHSGRRQVPRGQVLLRSEQDSRHRYKKQASREHRYQRDRSR